jgi:hypothetical protein
LKVDNHQAEIKELKRLVPAAERVADVLKDRIPEANTAAENCQKQIEKADAASKILERMQVNITMIVCAKKHVCNV